ncbi:MAG: PilZ domain-containing protein [Desulfatiglandales bacterium]
MDILDNVIKIGIISGVCVIALLFMWVGTSYVLGRRRSEQGNVEPIKSQGIKVEERRQQPRAELKWRVTMETPQGPVKAETKNVSLEGAFIRCENPMATSEVFPLSIEVPDHEPVDVTGEVVWSNGGVPADKVVTRGMGIRFIGISAEDRHLVNSAVQGHLEKGKESEKKG